jgi:hypothetical protein
MRTSTLLVALLLSSCNGAQKPADDTAPTDDGAGADGTWCAAVQVFDTSCVSCHAAGAGALGGLDLVTDPAAALIDHASANYPGHTLVVPGSPRMSFLFTKITGRQDAGEGDPMPPTAQLEPGTIATIRQWINAGAPTTCVTGADSGSGADSGAVARYHPEGWEDPTAHGLAAKHQESDCLTCHGDDLGGGTTGVSCDTCHQAGWRTDCTFCHGGTDNTTGAPPVGIDDLTTGVAFSAHTAHVSGSTHAAWDCAQCHAKPTDVLSPGHVLVDDATPGKAETVFTAGLSPAATWDGTAGCSNLYCHGNGHGTNGSAQEGDTMTCTSCHAGASGDWTSWSTMSGHHPTHLAAGFACDECHASTVTGSDTISGPADHVDGMPEVQFPSGMLYTGGQCTGSCHGESHGYRTW